MLEEATFVLRREEEPTFLDFQTWKPIGILFVYAHDELKDHNEWLKADYEEAFMWHGVYRNIIRPLGEVSNQPPTLIGIQLEEDEVIVLGEVANKEPKEEEEEEEAKEEEEDPKEEHKEGLIRGDPTIPWEDYMWMEEENDPHGNIHRHE